MGKKPGWQTTKNDGLPHTKCHLAAAPASHEKKPMALIAVSGHPGCRFEEVARIAARRLKFELVTQARVRELAGEEFGKDAPVPDKAYASLATSILARLGTEHHLVFCADGGEVQARHFPGMLRVHVVAPENVRIGNLMLDHRLERAAARRLLLELESASRAERKARYGKTKATAELFDLVLNAEALSSEQMAALIVRAVEDTGLAERGYLSAAADAQLQFQMRLKLARHGIVPPDKITLRKKIFANQSEEIFANLLDFYRIAWEYEPRSFAVQHDENGNVTEAFTPDFYLPEFDLYVELTTMKQSLVTRKNRKVRLLRELYPQLNIQVYYQKDFENLVFKYGLAGQPAKV
jgi:cytidylate kinase